MLCSIITSQHVLPIKKAWLKKMTKRQGSEPLSIAFTAHAVRNKLPIQRGTVVSSVEMKVTGFLLMEWNVSWCRLSRNDRSLDQINGPTVDG
jgi:hypothetical protein